MITGSKAHPNPVHAYETSFKTELSGLSAITNVIAETTSTVIRLTLTSSLSEA